MWKRIHEKGAQIFVACSQGAADIVGYLLEVAVL